jgi:hypothetical protein
MITTATISSMARVVRRPIVHFHQLACTPRLRKKLPNALMAASAELAIGSQITAELTW